MTPASVASSEIIFGKNNSHVCTEYARPHGMPWGDMGVMSYIPLEETLVAKTRPGNVIPILHDASRVWKVMSNSQRKKKQGRSCMGH